MIQILDCIDTIVHYQTGTVTSYCPTHVIHIDTTAVAWQEKESLQSNAYSVT